MALTRRDFLKLSVWASGLPILSRLPVLQTDTAEAYGTLAPEMTTRAVLYDASRCAGCRACEVACRRWNKRHEEESKPLDLSPNSFTIIKFREIEENGDIRRLPTKVQCMHCVDPTCATVCPTSALYKTELGPVLYDVNKCIGCTYCVAACPFSIPRFDWEERRITKCTLCIDRITNGLEPACVANCPVKALTFGDRQTIVAKAEEARAQGAYVYGLDEVGGLSWIYISDVPFEQRGLPTVGTTGFSAHSAGMLASQMATVAAGATAVGLYSWSIKGKNTEGE